MTAGDKLGPYEILAPVGAGGMGEVWKARDTRLDRIVAIKTSHAQFSERTDREARAIAALNHPHICHLYDVGPNYLVMEYIEGAPLAGPLAPEKALPLALKIVSALETAHSKGITHRDLKPANILVTASGIKLLDFGLAKLESTPDSGAAVTQTIAGSVVGTAAYMSPEQARGEPADARSDIFSFGLVLYEMISGRRAFAGQAALETMASILRDEPAPIDAPPALRNVIARCLRKVPADRFQSAAELRAALEAAAVSNVAASNQGKVPSIAVLPFANLSSDKEQEYFSDGLSEEIINLLAHIPGLKVIARTSAFAFRGKEQDIRGIAEALGVAHVLEGSVRRAGNRIRVTAQLINAEDGAHLWSERYDRELNDVFAIQDEIAQAITSALQVKIAAASARQERYMPSLPAYEALLKGRYCLSKWTPESLARAKGYSDQAIALDPNFALAYVQSSLYHLLFSSMGVLPANEAMPLARAEIRKALEIDPSLPEAHAALGHIACVNDFDYEEARRHFDLAMAQQPASAEVRRRYAFFLFSIGRPLEAIREVERVIQEDPLDVMPRMNFHAYLQAAGKDRESQEQLQKVLELDENFAPALQSLAIFQALQGALPEGLRSAQKAFSLAPSDPSGIATLAGLLRCTGDHSEAELLIGKLGTGDAFGSPRGFMIFHLLCGEVDQAAGWAAKMIAQRDPSSMLFLCFAVARPLRASPHWPALARMMNLPDVSSSRSTKLS